MNTSFGLYRFSESNAEALFDDCWLAPISVDGPLLTEASLAAPEPKQQDVTAVSQIVHAQDIQADAPTCGESQTDVAASNDSLQDQPSSSSSPRRRPILRRRRASDSPIIDVPWSEYLRVLESVARLTSAGQAGATVSAGSSRHLDEALRRWGMNPQAWLVEFQQLDRRCTRALGAAHHVLERAGEVAQRWFHGIRLCREIFAGSSSDAFT